MKRRSIAHTSVLLLIINLLVCSDLVFAETVVGDQFLDGIGETALIACYVFNGNEEDWSRNNYHATLHGTGASYVEDEQFGKVLSLPEGDVGGYVQIPGQALIGVDSVSITGWIYVRSVVPWQRFFDFGQNTTRNFFCTPIGEEPSEGYRARITITGWTEELGPMAPRIATDRWVHLAVVLDTAKQILSNYADGVKVGKVGDVDLILEQVLNQDDATANRLYIGKSQYEDANLNANVHDVRIYGIALTDKQIATIRNNALSDERIVTLETERIGEDKPAVSTKKATLPDALRLIGVPDITAETIVGHLETVVSLQSSLYPAFLFSRFLLQCNVRTIFFMPTRYSSRHISIAIR